MCDRATWGDRDDIVAPQAHARRRGTVVSERPEKHESASELLADWRSAERDTIAARTASRIATLALAAAEAAEEAANAVEAAASSVAEAVEHARAAASRARRAAAEAAEAAQLAFASAEGDEVRATVDVHKAEVSEAAARDAFHKAEDQGFPKS